MKTLENTTVVTSTGIVYITDRGHLFVKDSQQDLRCTLYVTAHKKQPDRESAVEKGQR